MINIVCGMGDIMGRKADNIVWKQQFGKFLKDFLISMTLIIVVSRKNIIGVHQQ